MFYFNITVLINTVILNFIKTLINILFLSFVPNSTTFFLQLPLAIPSLTIAILPSIVSISPLQNIKNTIVPVRNGRRLIVASLPPCCCYWSRIYCPRRANLLLITFAIDSELAFIVYIVFFINRSLSWSMERIESIPFVTHCTNILHTWDSCVC